MFKRMMQKQREKRFNNMRASISSLSDAELKEWYSGADLSVQLGHSCEHERALLRDVETELERRGFEFQTDF